jgi:hypothetical protein
MTGGQVAKQGYHLHGRPLRSHVERVIDPAEATVVHRIFELYDSTHSGCRANQFHARRHRHAPHSV